MAPRQAAGRDPGCLFCRIAAGEVSARLVYQDAEMVAFEDIHPAAPTHILLVPREHIASLAEAAGPAHERLLGYLQLKAAELAAARELRGGFRTVFNCGADAGQSVAHLHLHLLGGRALGWPPG